MKKISRLYGISLALCGLICFSSCNKDETETLATPTNLTVSSVTGNSAVLSWTSDATSFEIKVGDATYTSSANSYSLEDLSQNTTYSWSVKAVKGDISSEWVNGLDFVTDRVVVTFGDQVWSAKATLAIVDFEDPYMQVQLFSTEDAFSWQSMAEAEYPFFQFYLLGNTAGEYDEAHGYAPPIDYDFDYYHQNYIDVGALYGLDDEWITGDYWVDTDFPSSIEITAINASTVSGTINATLIDVMAYMTDETIINVPLSVSFVDLPVTDIASLSVPVPGSASKISVQSNPTLKPGNYPIKVGNSTKEKIKALKAKTK
jgi:hypothetical protein